MSRTVAISKFVGTISLGLLTGLSYTLSTTTIPPLLALPSATPAHSTFRHLRALTSRHQLLLSSLSASTLVMAYLLSPPRGRHPYLLYATLATAAGWGSEAYGKFFGKKQAEQKGAAMDDEKRGKSMRKEGSWTEDEEWVGDEEGNVNGEVVREGMEGWKVKQGIKAGVWGVGWVVALVGLWGDGV
ncbi:MAG: hypothetical protein L6R42_008371 [Xanthoria sp. 1 TBL-2021]|nr:MAG: hypothetical protein L6R42_008371 [Xanthoria sp. 1 TBL-2021]